MNKVFMEYLLIGGLAVCSALGGAFVQKETMLDYAKEREEYACQYGYAMAHYNLDKVEFYEIKQADKTCNK